MHHHPVSVLSILPCQTNFIWQEPLPFSYGRSDISHLILTLTELSTAYLCKQRIKYAIACSGIFICSVQWIDSV